MLWDGGPTPLDSAPDRERIAGVMTDYSSTLRGAGLRVTEPRLALLSTAQQGGHSSVEELRQGVIERIGSVSVQAVYDIVHALTTAGLLREVRSTGTVTYYEINRNDNHHHAICRSCGKIEDVPCAKGEKPCLDASHPHGYAINEAEVIYHGYCPDCQKQRQK